MGTATPTQTAVETSEHAAQTTLTLKLLGQGWSYIEREGGSHGLVCVLLVRKRERVCVSVVTWDLSTGGEECWLVYLDGESVALGRTGC